MIPVLPDAEQTITVRKLWLAADGERFIQEDCRNVRAVVVVGISGLPRGLMERLPKLELVACFGKPQGTVDLEEYAAGSALARAGVISGADMTAEAALAKLYYLFSRGLSSERVKEEMQKDLRGELTP